MNFQSRMEWFELPKELRKTTRKSALIDEALKLFSDEELFTTMEWRQALCVVSGEARTVTSYFTAQKQLSRMVVNGRLERVAHGVYRKPNMWRLD